MLTVKLSGFPDMHWRDLFTSSFYIELYKIKFKNLIQTSKFKFSRTDFHWTTTVIFKANTLHVHAYLFIK
jgi:hypothetical protein